MAEQEIKQMSIRMPARLYKNFKKWCIENDTTIQEAVRRFMEMMTEDETPTRRAG